MSIWPDFFDGSDSAECFGDGAFDADSEGPSITGADDLQMGDDEPRPIERDCSSCGEPYTLTIDGATAVAPGSKGDICPGCLKKMVEAGRKLLEGDKPVY